MFGLSLEHESALFVCPAFPVLCGQHLQRVQHLFFIFKCILILLELFLIIRDYNESILYRFCFSRNFSFGAGRLLTRVYFTLLAN
jgi:hypothetical protein